MQLVGAKQSFIKKPFLINSTVLGAIGGVLAASLCYGCIYWAYQNFAELDILVSTQEMILFLGSLVLFGAFLAFFSSLFSLNRYLKLSLDELY
jgi:cell division transport system permease protein